MNIHSHMRSSFLLSEATQHVVVNMALNREKTVIELPPRHTKVAHEPFVIVKQQHLLHQIVEDLS
jgi:hypothetical protein